MDVIIPRKSLVSLLQRVYTASDKKSAMPALDNVRLTTEGFKIRAVCTDLYITMSDSAEAEVRAPGSIAVPVRDLLDRARAMPDGPVHLSVSERMMSIKSVGNPRRYSLAGIAAEEFPGIPEVPAAAASLILAPSVLARLIERIYFSISVDETRAHVNSALFEVSPQSGSASSTVRMVSTDGHRLSMMEMRVDERGTVISALISRRAIQELRRLMAEADPEDKVEIRIVGPTAFFSMGSAYLSIKLVDGQFPPYMQVIPQHSDRQLLIPRAAFIDALKAIALAASDRTGGVKLALTSSGMRVTSEGPDTGAAYDEIAVDCKVAGEEISIGYNARYVLDILNTIETEEISLGLSGELDPGVISPIGEPPTERYLSVIMPMRL